MGYESFVSEAATIFGVRAGGGARGGTPEFGIEGPVGAVGVNDGRGIFGSYRDPEEGSADVGVAVGAGIPAEGEREAVCDIGRTTGPSYLPVD